MNYRSIYEALVSRAVGRVADGYTETHHITPKCLGGTDSPDNLVKLTAREHYLAHWLLAKWHKDPKLVFAWRSMALDPLGKRYTSHTFKYAKEAWAREMSAKNKGVKFSPERIANLSKAHMGQVAWNKGLTMPKSDGYHQRRAEYYANPKACAICGGAVPYRMRLRKNRQYCSRDCYFSDPETKNNLKPKNPVKPNSGSFKPGNVISEETANKISAKLTGMKRPVGVCPHCGKEGALSLLKRWHFDNCKELKC